MTPNQYEINTECDRALLNQIQKELQDITSYHETQFISRINDRWINFLDKFWKKARLVSMTIVVVGIILITFLLLIVIDKRDSSYDVYILLLIGYLVMLPLVYFSKHFPNFKKTNNRLTKFITHKSAQRKANKILSQAIKLSPFTAQYDFVGKTVTYHRLQKEHRTLVSSKPLEPYAIVHHHTALFYSSEKSIVSKNIVMYQDKQEIIGILNALDIKYVTLNP